MENDGARALPTEGGRHSLVLEAISDNTSLGINTTTESANSSHGRDEDLAKAEIAVLATVLFLAIFGNTMVLVALRYRQKRISRMHLFIMHLSIADLMVAFCNILPQLAWEITFRFHGNDFLCRVSVH